MFFVCKLKLKNSLQICKEFFDELILELFYAQTIK